MIISRRPIQACFNFDNYKGIGTDVSILLVDASLQYPVRHYREFLLLSSGRVEWKRSKAREDSYRHTAFSRYVVITKEQTYEDKYLGISGIHIRYT